MGGGTTAILSPSPSPYQSPQGTQVMTPGAASAMGAGIVQAHTSPIRQDEYSGASTGQYGASTGQYGAGGRGPDLPPPREPEKPKRNPTGPILVVAAGLAVIMIALLLLQPWKDDEGQQAADDSTTSDVSPADNAEETSESEEETTEDDGGGDQGSNDGEDEEEPEEEEHQTTEQASDLITVEDYQGWLVADAVSSLEEQGFNTIVTTESSEVVGEFAECEVVEQTPEAGAEVDWSQEVELSYIPGTTEDCGV